MTKIATPVSDLNIAIVTETWAPEVNGVAMTIGKLAKGLLANGCTLQLFRPTQGEANSHPQVEEYLLKGFRLPWYQQVRVGFPAGGYFKKTWEKSRPDAVIVVTEGPLGTSALRVARRLNIPVVSEFHTHFEMYSQFYHLGILFKMARHYLRWLHNQSDLTLVPTKALKTQMEANGFKHVAVLSRGVESKLFNPRYRCEPMRKQWGVGPDDLVAIFVGRLAPEKNLQLAINAFHAIKNKRADARFVIVGDGPLRTKLEKTHPEFIFCGMQTGISLAEHYASGDLFLSPSTTETFGNTLLEAMSSQLGVVTYDYAAAHEHVRDSENGLKVTLHDEDAFITAAVCLATKDKYRLKLAANARKTAESISWENICLSYLSLIRELITKEVQLDPFTTSAQSD